MTDTSPTAAAQRPRPQGARGFWVRQITTWHWMSAAIALLAMLGFAITGFTLNHADALLVQPQTHMAEATLPAEIAAVAAAGPEQGAAPLPAQLSGWLDQRFSTHTAEREADWSADEIYLTLTRPGADGAIAIDRHTGAVTFEETWRGWVSFFNDLHKGRNAGPYWTWFIDAIALACVLFCLTGLGILYLKSGARRATWPLVGLGLLIPLLLVLFLVH